MTGRDRGPDQNGTLRAYMVWVGEPCEGAALSWHYTSREARWAAVRDVWWLADEPTAVRARWLRNPGYLPRLQDEPHVIECPQTCRVCDLWTPDVHPSDGLCEQCRSDMEGDA